MNQQKITPYLVLLFALVVVIPLLDLKFQGEDKTVKIYSIEDKNIIDRTLTEELNHQPLLAQESEYTIIK